MSNTTAAQDLKAAVTSIGVFLAWLALFGLGLVITVTLAMLTVKGMIWAWHL
jgi:hypothetical protein